MSEEQEGPPEPQPAKPSRRRIAIMSVVAGLLASVLLVVVSYTSRRKPTDPAAPHQTGSALVRVPAAPQLGSAGPDGVRLTGSVVDGAGLPVVAAEVSAELEKGAADKALVGSAGSGSGSAAGIAVAAPTGPDGRFALEGLTPGRYRVRVTGAGLLAAEVRFVPVPSDETRIVVARQVSIDGTVTDGGKPVTTAMVGIRGDAIGGTLELKTDGKGAFHVPNLPEGRYQVYAWQGALAARTVRVARLGAGPFPPLELRLEAGAIVVGKVIDRDGGAGLIAAVELRPSGEDQAPRYARTGDDGVFRIEGVPTGRWIADAFAPGYLAPGGIELEAGHGVVELSLARGGSIDGRVLDGEGRPVAGAAVRALAGTTEISADVDRDRLRRFSGRTAAPPPDSGAGDPQLIARGELGVMVGPIPPIPPPGAEPARAASVVDPNAGGLAGEPPPLAVDDAHASLWTTDDTGRYRIRGLPKGKVTALAVAVGYAEARSRQVTLGAGESATGVDIVLSAGTYVVGKVTDQHGAAVVGAEITAAPEVGAPLEGFSDGEGVYKLGPLSGKIELHATAYGHVETRLRVDLGSPRGAQPGEHRENLVLEIADATLAGILDDEAGMPVGGARLEVGDGTGEGRRAITAADGTFSIDMLPRGRLRVHVDDARYPPADLEAFASTTGEHTHLRLPLGGAIEGVLLDATSGESLAGMAITGAGPSGHTSEAATDKLGRWKLGPLKPGHWKLEVKLPGYRTQTREVDVPASRAPGETSVRDVRIDLARGSLVGGVVRDRRGQRLVGAHVTVKLADGSGAAVEGDSDAQGEFQLHDCPAGDLVITATHGELSGAVRASVRGGAEVLGLSLELR
jgi:hypothetical protein